MQDFLRWLASWKGIAIEPGSELQFELSSFPTGGLGLLVLLGCALALLAVVFLYRRDGKNLTTWQRVVLCSLRAIAVLAAIALLLEPNLVAVKRETRPGHVLLLVDTSQSMSHLDAWRRESVQTGAAGWRALGVADPAAVPRVDLVKALLAHEDQALVKKLSAKNEAQLYAFAGNVEALPLVPPPVSSERAPGEAPLPAGKRVPRLDLARLAADGRFSNLGGSLRTALDKSRTAEIAAVVLLSDGRRNTGPQGAEVARILGQRKVPHTFVLGVGDPSETQAAGISRFEAPEKVFQKDPFELRANVFAQGYESTTVAVKLVRIDDKGGQQVVKTVQVQVGGDVQEAVATFSEITSAETGKFTYRVELAPPSGEPAVPERHQKTAMVEVLGERTRVLLVSGSPNHEFQILRNLLIRDKTIDVSCWLQSADPKFPQDGDAEVTIEKLPEDAQAFDPYDVVILIDPNQEKLGKDFADLLRRHIVENGCGLWWVCGEKHTLESLRQGSNTRPVAELLPIVPDIQFAERELIDYGLAFRQPFPWRLAPEGEDGLGSKIARISESRDESKLLWQKLPGFHFAFPVSRLKPAATVLAEHPLPSLKREGREMPLIAMQFVGAGRVLFTGTDETYRWRSIFEQAYNRFWVNGIRFLFEGRIHAGNARLRLLLGEEKLELGDAIRIAAEAKDETLQPLHAEHFAVSIEKDGQVVETLKLEPVAEAPGTFELQFRPTQTGSYRVRALQKEGREVEVGFQVVPAQIEREGPMDRAELAAIAQAPGGRLCETPAELLQALDEIPSRSATDTYRTPHAIWDSWGVVVFVLLVLSLEWLLRKRFNLL